MNDTALLDLSRKIGHCIRQGVLESDVYVITLGLTEVWRNNANGTENHRRSVAGRAEPDIFGVRCHHGEHREQEHPARRYGELHREFPNLAYWPSYEIALAQDVYQDDGRHVTPEGVKQIVDQFVSPGPRLIARPGDGQATGPDPPTDAPGPPVAFRAPSELGGE